jgi:predicted pyridoxine 5'-phosphate oxidase superfamily flavin-nucleotide-binding protein
MEAGGGWRTELTDDIAAFIHEQTSVFLATVNADGQPYVQHRGGPKGFLKVLDEHTLGLADFRGNKQYISVGNLSENKKAHLFLIDYEHQRRVKIWGEAEAIENDPALLSSLMPADYEATPERAIVFHVKTWDANCPQHIPQRFEAADVKAALEKRDARIVALEAEVASLRLRSS